MRVSAACLLLLSAACTPEPLQFADWTIPVPEGTKIIEYAAVPMEEREGRRIELVEDLVLGDASDPNQTFYNASDVGVDDDQNIYVVDYGNARVQVFDQQGRFLKTLGQRGQGPGEFEWPLRIAVSENRLVVTDMNRLEFWSLNGEYQQRVAVEEVRLFAGLLGEENGMLYGSHLIMKEPETAGGLPTWSLVFATFADDGNEAERLAEIPLQGLAFTPPGEPRPAPTSWPVPQFGVSPEGDPDMSAGDEYQVLALAADGSPRWALRTAWDREPLSQALIYAALEKAQERNPEATYADFVWPELMPALSHFAVDDHGHIYLYPFVPETSATEDRPVDVYSAEGEHLFSGMIPGHLWTRAKGDHVFLVGPDPTTEERAVFRYRLVEPF